MRAAASLTLAATLAGCTPVFGDAPEAATSSVCPTGYAPEATREARLLAVLASAEAKDAAVLPVPPDLARRVAPVCFGPARSLGVLAGERVVLRASASDEELAARLAHLAVHLEDGIGDGCARGLAAALASEQRARGVEDALRARLGLAPSSEERGETERDYARRCAR